MVENFHDGGSCVSIWKNGRRNGNASWVFPDGSTYVGTIENLLRTTANDILFETQGELFKGYGQLTNVNGNVIFKGPWKNTAEVTKMDGSTEVPFVWPVGAHSGNGIVFFKN